MLTPNSHDCRHVSVAPCRRLRLLAASVVASVALCGALVSGGAGCVVAVPLTPAPGYCNESGQPADSVLQEMFDNVNAYRTANGLSTLQYSSRLEAAASAQARDMFERSFFAHTNPDGNGPLERAVAAGTCLRAIGENIAMIPFGTADSAQQAWENSPAHDENMRHATWTHVGMGHYDAGNGNQYWVQVFGS